MDQIPLPVVIQLHQNVISMFFWHLFQPGILHLKFLCASESVKITYCVDQTTHYSSTN